MKTMFRKLRYLLFLVSLIGGYFAVGSYVQAATCTLVTANWSKTSSTAGSPVDLVLGGDNCMGQEVSFDVQQRDVNNNITSVATLKGVFDTPGVSVGSVATARWTIDGGRGGYIFNYVAKCTKIDCGSRISVNLVIPKQGSSCVLGSATWVVATGSPTTRTYVGDSIGLKVVGQGCDGFDVSFDMYEWDPTKNDYLRTVKTKFQNGIAKSDTILAMGDFVKGGDEYVGETLVFEASVFDGSGSKLNTVSSPKIVFLASGTSNQQSYACVADDGKYACSPSGKQDLSDVPNNACKGKENSVTTINTSKCDTLASSSGTGGGTGTGGTSTQSWACIAGDNKYACSGDGTQGGLSSVLACSGKTPVQISTSSCGELAVYACIPKNATSANQYSCSPSNKADCSDVAGGCSGGCVQVPQSTCSKSYTYSITNPLAGGPNDLFDIIDIVTKWIMYISIPLAVLFIMYAGFLMLTAGPVPANFQKGRDILKYVILGLAIIFIGKGFVSLIISIIELGGTTPTTQTQNGGTGALGGARSMGWTCSNNSDCNSGLKCQNTMCVSVNGNIAGEPCLSGNQCAQDFTCDSTTPAQKQIAGRTVGTCFKMLCSPTTNKCTLGPKSGQTCTNTNDCE